MVKRVFILGLCLLLLLPAGFSALAEDTAATADTAVVEDDQVSEEVVQDYVEEDAMSDYVSDTDQDTASIEGLTALYTTEIKLMTSTGTAATMRAEQSDDADAVVVIGKGEVITIYKVYPAYVLAEYEGNVGFVKRTCIDENCTTLNPETTAPYGVTMNSYVATTTAVAPIYTEPDNTSEIFPIEIGAGSPVAILEFVDGYAKVLYWRSYGYIDATLLTDLVVVSQTDEPMSEDTPIAAFSSFFKYNTSSELNDGRVKNIVRSCSSMTRVMQPGEQLDFNNQVGPYKKANGYFPAPVLIGGGSQPGYGGGTCQSSSTLYNAVRQLPGITIVYRRPHGPGCARYLPMHQDAAVGNDTLNFIFENDYDFPISILAECTGEGVITIQVFKVTEE